MAKVKNTIIQIDNKADNTLRQIARDIKKSEFGSDYLKDVISAMSSALVKEQDGVAIAAPQINLPLRIFLVSESAYDPKAKWKPLVFINPKIVKASRKTEEMHEGCLSVRWIYGKTKRHSSVTIEAYDVAGNKFTFGASGLIAQIFQHETEHLEGVLFIDHGYAFEEYSEEEVRAAIEKDKNK
jgi:peptide deformylase